MFQKHKEPTLEDVIERVVARVNTHTDQVVEKGFDEFAIIVGKQFNRIDEQFKDVYRRFDLIDERFDTLEARMDSVARLASKHDGQFKGMKSALQHA